MNNTTTGQVQPSDVRPPIPARLANRPMVGGLVIPWVNVTFRDGGCDFRSTHGTRWRQAWTDGLCQTCGKPLTRRPVVMIGGPRQLDTYFTEPPLHPECANYASKACPMVAGRRTAYAATEATVFGHRGDTCPDEGCDCAGWVPEPGEKHLGEPAHDWWAVWCDDWQVAVDPDGRIIGGVPVGVRRRRLISIAPSGSLIGGER